jgi:hypothetical protein
MGRWECKEHADEVKGRGRGERGEGRGERGERREERADVCWGSRDEAETRQIEETTVVGKGMRARSEVSEVSEFYFHLHLDSFWAIPAR